MNIQQCGSLLGEVGARSLPAMEMHTPSVYLQHHLWSALVKCKYMKYLNSCHQGSESK